MRRVLMSALATGALALAAGPAAADMARGTIASIDSNNNAIKLQNGSVYKLGTPLSVKNYSVGDSVVIDWNTYEQGYRLANEVSKLASGSTMRSESTPPSRGAAYANVVTGTIKRIDPVEQRIDLADGSIYELATGMSAGDFKVGERVKITWYHHRYGFRLATKVEPVKTMGMRSSPATSARAGLMTGPTQEDVGVIDKVLSSQNQIVLKDGQVYELRTGLDADSFAPGEMVKITWNTHAKEYRLADEVHKVR